MNTADHANKTAPISYRLGAALRDETVPAFVRSLTIAELTELARVAPALAGSMVSEASVYSLTGALYSRTEELDAKGAVKRADAAQAAQVAWTEALQAWQRAQRAAA